MPLCRPDRDSLMGSVDLAILCTICNYTETFRSVKPPEKDFLQVFLMAVECEEIFIFHVFSQGYLARFYHARRNGFCMSLAEHSDFSSTLKPDILTLERHCRGNDRSAFGSG